MNTNERSSIAVSGKTRDMLNEMRGRYTSDEFLVKVLTFLKLYGLNPVDVGSIPANAKLSNCNDVLKRIEDVIKIIRSFEKGMKEMCSVPNNGTQVPITDTKLMQENKKLKEALEKLREEISASDGEEALGRVTRIHQLVMEFLDANTSDNGTLFVGKTRLEQFRGQLKEAFHG